MWTDVKHLDELLVIGFQMSMNHLQHNFFLKYQKHVVFYLFL